LIAQLTRCRDGKKIGEMVFQYKDLTRLMPPAFRGLSRPLRTRAGGAGSLYQSR
jgi:hypothetical protein